MPSHQEYIMEQDRLFNTLSLIKGLGKFIHLERKKQNLSIEKLAEISSVSYYTVYRLEHGGNVKISFLIAILQALGYTLAIRRKEE